MSVRQLRRLVREKNIKGFCEEFSRDLETVPPAELESLRTVAGEALDSLILDPSLGGRECFRQFAEWFTYGFVRATPQIASILLAAAPATVAGSLAGRPRNEMTVEVRRGYSLSRYEVADFRSSDSLRIRTSVFRSPQERAFNKALTLRFPAYDVLPNYPLDQLLNLDRLKELLPSDVFRFGRLCRLDSVLVTPYEGDPIAAFELDSAVNDRPEQRARDDLKNRLMALVGIPLFRIRMEGPGSASPEHFFALLTAQVVHLVGSKDPFRDRDRYPSFAPKRV